MNNKVLSEYKKIEDEKNKNRNIKIRKNLRPNEVNNAIIEQEIVDNIRINIDRMNINN